MPVQHGNNEILRRMARRTTQEQMVERINKIREKMPDCTIRTSIIVGFPGETEEQFNDLYEFVKKVRFDRKKILLRLIFRIRLMRKSRKNVLTDL